MRGSLRTCPEALRLEDVLETNGLVLFSLDVADYPHAAHATATRLARVLGRTCTGCVQPKPREAFLAIKGNVHGGVQALPALQEATRAR